MPITRFLQACRRELAALAANVGPRTWPGQVLPPADLRQIGAREPPRP